MSTVDLDAIEARLNRPQPHRDSSAAAWGEWAATQQRLVETDVPALVARVRELESVVQRVRVLIDGPLSAWVKDNDGQSVKIAAAADLRKALGDNA